MVDLVAMAKKEIKSKDYIAKQTDIDQFTANYLNTKKVIPLDVVSEDGRVLHAHKMEIGNDDTIPSPKKAIICITGNKNYVAEVMPNMEEVLNQLKKQAKESGQNYQYACYVQDYRGRGFNQANPDENWNDYSVLIDAKDSAALIKKVIADGYKPEDILILGQSYGTSVALWMLDLLDAPYNAIKLFCDRGLGNPFEDSRLFMIKQADEQKKMFDANMMPEIPFHDIAVKLPNVLIENADNDKIVKKPVALTTTFKENEWPGHVWKVKSNKKDVDEHTENLELLNSSNIPELTPMMLLTAMINEQPIKLNFNFKIADKEGNPIQCFQLRKGATPEQVEDYVAFPEIKCVTNKGSDQSKPCLSINSNVVQEFLNKLVKFSLELVEKAQNSGNGGAYKKLVLGKQYPAIEKINNAIEIIQGLCAEGGPNVVLFKALDAIKSDEAPHKLGSSDLFPIFEDIAKFINEYEQLQKFNAWIIALRQARQENAAKASNVQPTKVETVRAEQVNQVPTDTLPTTKPAVLPSVTTPSLGLFAVNQNNNENKAVSDEITVPGLSAVK